VARELAPAVVKLHPLSEWRNAILGLGLLRRPAGASYLATEGRISVNYFGHIDPLLAFPAVLRLALREQDCVQPNQPAENKKC
jgi:hypothetical protein